MQLRHHLGLTHPVPLPPTAEMLMTMSINPIGQADVKAVFDQLSDTITRIHIDLPEQCNVVKRAHALVDRSPLMPAQILAIESESLLGKTRVLDIISGHIRSVYTPQVEGWTCRVTCGSETDGRTLGIRLCHELRVPPIGLGSTPRLGDYISKQIALRQPLLLAIDNAHLLTDGGIPYAKAHHLLETILASGVAPVILSGRAGTLAVARRLQAKVGQIIETMELCPLPYNSGADLNRIRDFLLIVDGDLFPLFDRIRINMTLSTDDFAKRFWGASWGAPGIIMALLRETLRMIIQSRVEKRDSSRYSVKREDSAEA